MNPCQRNKQAIALLAADVLEPAEARLLREHLRGCRGCQEYWRQMLEVCREQGRLAGNLPSIEPGEHFHQRLRRRVEAHPASPRRQWWELAFGRIAEMRRGIAIAATVLAILAVIFVQQRRAVDELPAKQRSPVSSQVKTPDVNPDTSLVAYRRAASRSFDELDQLLARDASRLLPPDREAIPTLRGQMEAIEAIPH